MNKIAVKAAFSFLIFTPLVTFILLTIKGLPAFASGRAIDVLLYVYQATWMPALIAGILFSLVLKGIRPRLGFFTEPYDFGRCLSLGAITGALVEALSTGAYRALTRHPFSGFWIAGAMIAGSITGSIVVPILFRRFSQQPILKG